MKRVSIIAYLIVIHHMLIMCCTYSPITEKEIALRELVVCDTALYTIIDDIIIADTIQVEHTHNYYVIDYDDSKKKTLLYIISCDNVNNLPDNVMGYFQCNGYTFFVMKSRIAKRIFCSSIGRMHIVRRSLKRNMWGKGVNPSEVPIELLPTVTETYIYIYQRIQSKWVFVAEGCNIDALIDFSE